MPVPVPARTPAHQIHKPFSLDAHSSCLAKQSALKHLLTSLPAPPTGPPPAFTDRETWIKSLPPARRYKIRQEVVTPTSGTPSVVTCAKGAGKDAIMSKVQPPSTISVPSATACSGQPHSSSAKSGVALNSVDRVAHAPLSNGKPWPPSPPTAIKQAIKADERRKSMLGEPVLTCDSGRDADDELSEDWTEDEAFFAGPAVCRQTSGKRRVSLEETKGNSEASVDNATASETFNPVVEFDSDVDVPLAPFDGTLAASATAYSGNEVCEPATRIASVHDSTKLRQEPIEPHLQSIFPPSPKALSPIPTTITPADMLAYNRKIAEPMSEWVAEYIWKVVTHGMSLPPEFVANKSGYGAPARAYAAQPPAYLADSIRTLLCATLLQPSAIFLALWYIARFPVFFGVFSYNSQEHSKEYKFRLELLGEGSQEPGAERTRQLLEAHAPFRLLLLGVMLANKWLDDNTFSNKTWHQVSGVPMRALNKLESLGLDLLSHDLSLLPRAWEQWLDHMQTYHRSLAPYPEPIGPPKDTPHVIIRRVIEDLIAAGSPPISTGVLPEPVFLGLEERKKERERERLAKEQVDLFDLDLDEDGPLREEYLPRKPRTINRKASEQLAKELPPPAEWSPAADPPIHRTRPTYQAVQRPPPAPILANANAHVPEMVLQATGYLNRADNSFQGARNYNQSHVPAHERANSYGWTRYAGQPDRFGFAQSGPPTYVPTCNGQYPVMNIPTAPYPHPGPWPVQPLFVNERSGYQPLGTFDAPPASDLFRPTWLRT